MECAKAIACGEALLPMGLAQSLAATARAVQMPDSLTEIEETLVSALALGHAVQKIASDLNYSDRTIRRKLQTLYVKLGVATRGEAVRRCREIASAAQADTFET
ncbi:MAG: LuxR C-terminal-related transcriptional regulator [Acidimicrobiaceae bacterium]|nr:LuxR C-terminal-related transcriptional regulator [Acidimicrobiaceae bacterium]